MRRESRHRRVFAALRALRALEKHNVPSIRTLEDRDLLCEIGYRQASGAAMCLKQVLLLGLGSPSTVQRQIRRLHLAGAIALRPSSNDGRMVEVILTASALRGFAALSALLPRKVQVKNAA